MRLVARPTQVRIVAAIGRLTVDHEIDPTTPVDDRHATPTVVYTGQKHIHPDSYEPLTTYGEDLYLGEDGGIYLAGDLELHHEGGLEEELERPLTPPPPERLPGGEAGYVTRALHALKYAEWIIHTDHAHAEGEIDAATRDRVQRRAREHARSAGVELLVEAVVAATKL